MFKHDISLRKILIAAVNIEQMLQFYETVFNAIFRPLNMGRFMVYEGHIGEFNITLVPNEMVDVRAEKSRYQLTFAVPDLERAVYEAKRAGGIQMQEISFENGEKYCGITDPDGNSIELVEPVALPAF